jgi:hypothetical protein
MKRICGYLSLSIAMMCIPLLGTWHLVSYFQHQNAAQLIDRFITVEEVTVGVVFVLLVAWTILVFDAALGIFQNAHGINLSYVGRPTAWIAGTLALTPQVQPSITTTPPAQSVPVTAVVSPAIAAAVLRHVLARRRAQIHDEFVPDQLTSEEVQALSNIVTNGLGATPEECDVDLITHADVVQVLRAVERPSPSAFTQTPLVVAEWAAVVQVFGYPQVMSPNGDIATFRKKRSLELLTWLSLNRDRSRRSAARTALWEFSVNDSTFSTVVSDMRRGLCDLSPTISRDEWVPVTFTDHIPLSPMVVTDAELLQDALQKFRINAENIEELLVYLGWVRDVPFAGTSYSWADLDGSTTRLVILAMSASREVAQWAAINNHHRAREIAVSAGLRLMPGDEELLAVLTY